ncbi:GCN5-related N-acetyltransferase [Desulfurella amilsii]|uniref:GCN5-related N-acetyltransferase n=1 Tax=Desulfurella amilsii TaxID=1562698 RepID=A0A1X4XV10_9BACT|nr:N-acetyltransferase [Desulfurella amilsii]OSS41376.1 GCN5-related N-acetyltransferase [Desulfurella amilsii]
MIEIVKPTILDCEQMKTLIDKFAKTQVVLPRPIEDVAERIREFYIAKDGTKVIATSSLRIFHPNLAEIRTITIDENYQKQGLGRKLIEKELGEAKALGITRVFALTMQVEFFKKMRFAFIDKKNLPLKKIWEDCIKCPLFPDCNEEALIIDL